MRFARHYYYRGRPHHDVSALSDVSVVEVGVYVGGVRLKCESPGATMEVLVLAARDSADLHLDAILHALQASARPIDVIDCLPSEPLQLQANQLVLTRKHMTDEGLAGWLQYAISVPSIHDDRTSLTRSAIEHNSTIDQDITQYIRKISKKNKKIRSLNDQIASLKQSLVDVNQRVKHMELEQEQFFEDVQELKTQFDRLSDAHSKVLWDYLPARDSDMRAIPLLSTQIDESPTCVGPYPLEQVLGYGQYAVVYSSTLSGDPQPLAVKAIDKNKVIDIVSLNRINSEIASLSDPSIQHPCILRLKDVIHTKKHVYLITERGGKDLFEFFGAHQIGIDEKVIKPLMLRVAQAVSVLHRHNYCHRDLKPENILYSPDDGEDVGSSGSGSFLAPPLVKLIDFGLCTKAITQDHDTLRDFCGSPGFFAPEMLLADNYDGFKADVWSVGCILLELVLGNTAFSTDWMTIYELSILKDHERFAECIRSGLDRTREFCNGPKWTYSSKLRHLLLSLLAERPAERFSIHQMLDHPWFTTDASLMATYGENQPQLDHSPSSHRQFLHPHHQHLQHQQTAPMHLDPDDSVVVGGGGGSSPLGRRPSPSKIKSFSTSSAPSMNSIRLVSESPTCLSTGALDFGGVANGGTSPSAAVRPLSPPISSSSSLALALAMAEDESPVFAPTLASSSSPGKVSLPSLSPEKPNGQRSPERTFAKRPAHPSPERPTSPKF